MSRRCLYSQVPTDIPRDYKTDDGIWLGTWLYRQRRLMEGYPSRQKLDERRREMLRKLDIWEPDARVDRRTKKYKRANTADRVGPV